MNEPGAPGHHRIGRNFSAVVLLAAVVGGILVLSTNSPVGMLEDDGIYLATGKALAEGRGYRHAALPGTPLQTKYPVLYPLVLAGVWKLWPPFPDNIILVRALNSVFAAGGLLLVFAALRCVAAVPVWLVAAGLAVTAINPSWWVLANLAMSEHLYGLLAASAIWSAALAAGHGGTQTADRRRELLWSSLAGLAGGAAFLTRTIGLTLVVAVPLGLLLSKRWRGSVVASLPALLAVAGWYAWRSAAAAANAAIPAAAAFTYDLGYSNWLAPDLPTQVWVTYLNTSRVAVALLAKTVFSVDQWVAALILGSTPLRVLGWLLVATLVALLVRGCVLWCRLRQWVVPLYVGLYLLLVLAWPNKPDRFLVPLLPYLTVGVLSGLAGRLTTVESRRPMIWAAAALVGCTGLVHLVVGQSLQGRGLVRWYPQARQALVEALCTQTPADAVIAAHAAGYLHLMTGRHIVPPLPMDTAVPIQYAPDSQWRDAGLRISKGGLAAAQEAVDSQLPRYLARAGVTHLVARSDRARGAELSDWAERNTARLTKVAEIHPYVLYALRGASP